jgi:hypothetical protein
MLKMQRGSFFFLFVLVACQATPPASAQPFEHSVRRADLIVQGFVETVERQTTALGEPVDYAMLRIHDTIVGEAPNMTLTVTAYPNRMCFASPRLVQGEEVILILNENNGEWRAPEHFLKFKVTGSMVGTVSVETIKTKLRLVARTPSARFALPFSTLHVGEQSRTASSSTCRLTGGMEEFCPASSAYGPLSGQITLNIDPDGAKDRNGNPLSFSTIKAVVDAAVQEWNNAQHTHAYFTVSNQPYDVETQGNVGVSVIWFEDLKDVNGQSNTGDNNSDGILDEVDILLNALLRWNTSSNYIGNPLYNNPYDPDVITGAGTCPQIGPVDLQDVLTHELGHGVGLAHPEVSSEQLTMQGTDYTQCTQGQGAWWEKTWRRDLMNGDKLGKIYYAPKIPGSQSTQQFNHMIVGAPPSVTLSDNFTVGSGKTFETETNLVVASGTTLSAGADATIIATGSGTALDVNGAVFLDDDADLNVESGASLRFLANASSTMDPFARITVNSGAEMELQQGVDFTLQGASTSIHAYGKLKILGTASNRVTLHGSGTSIWYGLVLEGSGASNSIIQYADISNVTTGLWISSLSNLHVSNVNISNAISYNLFAHALSGSDVTGSTFDDSDYVGVEINNGGLRMIGNTITNSTSSAARLQYASAVYFGEGGGGGFNTITGNGSYGVYAYASSAILGDDLGPFVDPYGGYNSIYGNNREEVRAVSGSDVMAELNWWGQSPPRSSEFYASSNSTLDYDPWLTSAPSAPAPPATPSLTREDARTAALDAPNVGTFVRHVQRLRDEEDNLQAERFLVSIIASNHQYAEAARLLHLADLLLLQRFDEVIAEGEKLLAESNLGTEEKVQVGLALFTAYLRGKNNRDAAQFLVKRLSRLNVDPDDRRLALLATRVGMTIREVRTAHRATASPTADLSLTRGIATSKRGEPSMTSKGRFAVSNYPNPFNPVTFITYTLPDADHVQLRVYDPLGREVARLLDSQQSSGTHRVVFDAAHLPSGVYYYRFETSNQIRIHPMLLLK